MHYRAIYFVEDGINVWYWIGTHAAISPCPFGRNGL